MGPPAAGVPWLVCREAGAEIRRAWGARDLLSFLRSLKQPRLFYPPRQGLSPPTSPGLPVAGKGARVKGLARCAVVGNLKKIWFSGENRGSRSLRVISTSLVERKPSGLLPCSPLSQSTTVSLLCDLKSYFRVNKWPGKYLQGEVWLNMEKWLLMDEKPEASWLLEHPRPRTLESRSFQNYRKLRTACCIGQLQVDADILRRFTELLLTESAVLKGGLPHNFLKGQVNSPPNFI